MATLRKHFYTILFVYTQRMCFMCLLQIGVNLAACPNVCGGVAYEEIVLGLPRMFIHQFP